MFYSRSIAFSFSLKTQDLYYVIHSPSSGCDSLELVVIGSLTINVWVSLSLYSFYPFLVAEVGISLWFYLSTGRDRGAVLAHLTKTNTESN